MDSPARGLVAVMLWGACIGSAMAASVSTDAGNGRTSTDFGGFIRVDGRDLQQVIDEAPPHSTILCNPNRQIVLSVPVRIHKSLTLLGLNARLPDKLGSTPLVMVAAKGVTISGFQMTGNGDTVSQDERAPLLVIGAGDFRVENGAFFNSSKDGVMIDGDVGDRDVVGGVVRDIVGRKIKRDTVSISGSSKGGPQVRNVLVDNIRCYESAYRGCVEVSDGTDNITVRKIYAESSVYAVDVQDHDESAQINCNVVVEDVYALQCKHAIRTSNHPLGHANLTVRDITARKCDSPVQISNTDNLTLSNVRIIDHSGRRYPVHIKNCRGVWVRDVMIENTDHKGPAMLIEDCDSALIDGFTLRGKNENLGYGISFRVTSDRAFSGLRISNVFAPHVTDAGIIVEDTSRKGGTLSDYVISGNVARVIDRIQGPRAIIMNNRP